MATNAMSYVIWIQACYGRWGSRLPMWLKQASPRPSLRIYALSRPALCELHIDRAYLSSSLVRDRAADLQVYCKAWPVRNGNRFPKTAFQLDWERRLLRCPNQQELPFEPGGVVQFPAEICHACP